MALIEVTTGEKMNKWPEFGYEEKLNKKPTFGLLPIGIRIRPTIRGRDLSKPIKTPVKEKTEHELWLERIGINVST